MVAGSSNHLTVFDATTGDVASQHSFATSIIDIEMLPDSRRALVVTDHTWPSGSTTPKSELVVIDLEAGGERRFDVPNCADDIAVTKSGTRALLAPTRCSKDPVSVIELTRGQRALLAQSAGFRPGGDGARRHDRGRVSRRAERRSRAVRRPRENPVRRLPMHRATT